MKMRELYDSSDDQFVLFYDNAAVHKTKSVVDEVRRKQSLTILNCPYAPELNFCEKFIRLHKRKL